MNHMQDVTCKAELIVKLEDGALDHLSLYNKTFAMIRAQLSSERTLALRALSWLAMVEHPLNVQESCRALAMQYSGPVF